MPYSFKIMYSSYLLNNDHKSSLSFVFHRSDKGQNKKRHKDDDDFVLLSLCLKGTRVVGGENNDDHKSLLSSPVFHKNIEG
jgi:hypothetical protein